MPSVIMDSPAHQSNTPTSRVRSHTSSVAAQSSVDHRGAIHKRSSTAAANHRNRAISASQADRLYRLAAAQSHQPDAPEAPLQPASIGVQWITPQHSPQLHGFHPEPALEPFPQWTVPTPPRSESGVPSVSLDSHEEPTTTGISSGHAFAFDQPAVTAEMSNSLGFLLPSQYGTGPYESDANNFSAMDQNYIPPVRMSQPPSTSSTSAYAPASSSPAYHQSRGPEPPASRRQSEMPTSSSGGQSYDQSYRRTSHPYESSYSSNYSVAPSQTIPSIRGITSSPLPSPHVGSTSGTPMMPQYQPGVSRSPSMYESNPYGQAYTTGASQSQMYATSQSNMTYPPPFVGSNVNEVLAKPLGADSSIRVLNQRPKPQCWEHGCNGRQFSTFSNLLRHQREKSGTAAKSYCPRCNAEFTRTTARNGHLAHDKCTKQRQPSDE